MRIALQQERVLHKATRRLLHEQCLQNTAQAGKLQEEIQRVSGALEQKEEDLMVIQFDMADLQNRLTEQARTCEDSAKELKEGKAQLAERDKRLQAALGRQQEFTAQIEGASELGGRSVLLVPRSSSAAIPPTRPWRSRRAP